MLLRASKRSFNLFLSRACLVVAALCRDAAIRLIREREFRCIILHWAVTPKLWKRFITTHRANFEPQGRYVVCSEHFTEDCFSRTVHDGRSMKRLVKEAVPTIWRANEKAPGSSVRDRRMVSISRVNYIAMRTFVFASQIHLSICYYWLTELYQLKLAILASFFLYRCSACWKCWNPVVLFTLALNLFECTCSRAISGLVFIALFWFHFGSVNPLKKTLFFFQIIFY